MSHSGSGMGLAALAMMHRTSFLALAASMLLLACGGSVETSGTALPGGTGGASGTGGSSAGGSGGASAGGSGGSSDPLEGSYDLAFTNIEMSSSLPSDHAISEGVPFRLDLRKHNGGLLAVLTPRWGDQFFMDASLSSSELRLTGSAKVSGTDLYASGSDTWDSLALALQPDGSLSGKFTAKGEEDVITGDIGWMAELDGIGTLKRDELAPESKLLPPGVGSPPLGRLPWEKLAVRFAEGMQPGEVPGSAALQNGGMTVEVAWEPLVVSTLLSSVAGTIAIDGYVLQWSQATAGVPVLSMEDGLRDLVSHPAPGWNVAVPVTDPGPPVDAVTFDGDASPMLAQWSEGDVHWYGQKTGSDPHCENSGCVQIGPYPQYACPAKSMGIAGRISTPMGTVSLRYRMLAAVDPYQSGAPADWSSPFWVDVAVPGLPPESTEAPAVAYTTYLGPDDNGVVWWASDWTNLNAQVPPGAASWSEVGFAVHTGSRVNGCIGEPMPDTPRALAIESVVPLGIK